MDKFSNKVDFDKLVRDQFESLVLSYLPSVKRLASILTVSCIIAVGSFSLSGLMGTDMGIIALVQSIVLLTAMIVFVGLAKKFPFMIKYLVSSFGLLCLVFSINSFLSSDNLESGDWVTACVALLIIILVSLPHHWKLSSVMFGLGMAYYVYAAFAKYGVFPDQLALCCTA